MITEREKKLLGDYTTNRMNSIIANEIANDIYSDHLPFLNPLYLRLNRIDEYSKETTFYWKNDYTSKVPDIINHWRTTDKYSDNYTRVMIIEGVNEEHTIFTASLFFEMDGYSCSCSHDCCGHKFAHPVRIMKVNENRYAFSQRICTNE